MEVWKECRVLRKQISGLVKTFPIEEKYRLVDQLIRASRFITANIAEGHGRFNFQDNTKFCRNSRGSVSEVLDHQICAYDENYIDAVQLNEYRLQVEKCLKLINGYIAYLQKCKNDFQ